MCQTTVSYETMGGATQEQFTALQGLYNYYNAILFAGQLPACLVNLSRKNNAHGFFAPERWKETATAQATHEISINPDTMDRTPDRWHSTLVHEMAHLWQAVFGTPSRTGYHNAEWAAKMEDIGLIPSDTGQPGGKKTGQRMTHYMDENGAFMAAFLALPMELTLPFASTPVSEEDKKKKAKRNKVKYVCPCGNQVWGKPKLLIMCEDCEERYQPDGQEEEM